MLRRVEPALVATMKTGKQIAYLGIDVTGRALSIPLPLEGFAKAIDGQPVPVDKYNEDQKKIAEVIRQRLADLRAKQAEAAKPRGTGQPSRRSKLRKTKQKGRFSRPFSS